MSINEIKGCSGSHFCSFDDMKIRVLSRRGLTIETDVQKCYEEEVEEAFPLSLGAIKVVSLRSY